MNGLIIAVIFLMAVYVAIFEKKSSKINNLCFIGFDDDSDIKIAPDFGAFSEIKEESFEETDLEADEFVRQKKLGNVEKARELGKIYAMRLINCDAPANSEKVFDELPIVIENRKILFSFAVNKALHDLSPNAILANTSLAVFYDEIKKDEIIYSQINNTGAISLYMLTGRINRPTIGNVFAKLCDKHQNQAYIDLGNNLYNYYFKYCRKELQKINYI